MDEPAYDPGQWGHETREAGGRPFAQALTQRQLSLVRARLIANLGSAVASWFRIVPSDHTPGGELRLAALLLDAHLPILVPITDSEAGACFLMARYDMFGRRVELSARGEMSRFSSLAEALLASDIAFRDLKYHRDAYRADRVLPANQGSMPEERWLHEQLRGVAADD